MKSINNQMLSQKGTAIVIALFIVALVAAAAIAMIERLQIDTRRTELLLNNNEANLMAQGSVIWAIDLLRDNWMHQKSETLIDRMPIQSPMDKENGVQISSVIYDAQSYFNLNNLTDPEYQETFTRLIQIINPKIDATTAKSITTGIVDWIQPGISNTVFDQYYAKLKTPYRSSHHPMTSLSELRLVKGITAKFYNQFAPYLTVLPSSTSININSTSAPILMSLSLTMSPETANALVHLMQLTPFPDIQHFLNFDVVKNNTIKENKITVTSEYFLVKTNVTLGNQQMILYTLLQRLTKNPPAKVVIVWQMKETL